MGGRTNARRLAMHSALNLLGLALPLVVAVISYPVLTRALEAQRFGALTLLWALAGYASVLDLGLGRALTQMVSRHLAVGDEAAVRSSALTAVTFSVVAGAVFGLAASLVAGRLAALVGLGGAIAEEATQSIRYVLLALPLLVLSPTLRGLLEARRRFPVLAGIRAVTGALSFLGPAVAVTWTTDLGALILVTLGARAVEALSYLVLAGPTLILRGSITSSAVNLARLRELLRVGGWMSVSNVIAPILLQFDRFVVGNLLSLSSVAYYATPQSVVTRLQLVPRAAMGVLFPELSRWASVDPVQARRLSRRASLFLVFLMAVPCIVIIVWAEPLLRAWLGDEFARNGATVTRLLAFGVLMHTVGQVPFGLLQATGRSRLTALVHLIEAPVYVVYLYILTTRYGIEGTAAAWLVRVTMSAVVLTVAARRVSTPKASVAAA